jgi:Zn-dependent peptidase ImmA (M78 family)
MYLDPNIKTLKDKIELSQGQISVLQIMQKQFPIGFIKEIEIHNVIEIKLETKNTFGNRLFEDIVNDLFINHNFQIQEEGNAKIHLVWLPKNIQLIINFV